MRFRYIGIFIIFNLMALALGGLFTGEGVPSEWYTGLNKAPWTPPGWVFGAAWTTIMICFGIFLGFGWNKTKNRKRFIVLYILQWILNVVWSLLFFKMQLVLVGLVEIILLFVLMCYYFVSYWKDHKLITLLLMPYILWLCIAISLNAYIYIFN
jgi:tryptophan-rich sensory protein